MTSPDHLELQEAAKRGTQDQQKALLEKLFQDVNGLRKTAISGMHASTDFYFTRVVQVRLSVWHQTRCALVGDAGYCPSPLTGQGTTIALLGAYILAGELSRNPDEPSAAFAEYQRKFGGFVKEEGSIPLGGRAPEIFMPQSDLGVGILRVLFRVMGSPMVQWLWDSLPGLPSFGRSEPKIKLDDYKFGEE